MERWISSSTVATYAKSMANPATMIMTGTTRMVVKSRALPRSLPSQPRRILIARLRAPTSAAEPKRFDVLPGNVQSSLRRGSPQDRGAQVDVVGFHAGAVDERDVGGIASVGRRDVGGQGAVRDRQAPEGHRRDIREWNLSCHPASIHRDLLGLSMPLDGVRGLVPEEP